MKKKHKITLLVIGILLALSLMLSSSYALWVFNVSQESTNVVVSDCFEITFTDGSDAINLTNSFPMKDGKGVYTTPYEFTLTNICEHAADISINVETLNDSQIAGENLRVDVNGHIHTYGDNNYVEPTLENASSAASFYNDTIAAGNSKSYNLRLWIKNDVNSADVINKSLRSKVTVKSTLRKKYSEGVLISGRNFNVALKTLADGGKQYYYFSNDSIKSIEWSDIAPEESDNAVNLAEAGTITPIYAWFKDGTIYINSKLDKIYMNPDSSYMFYDFFSVTNLDLSHFDTSKVTNMSNMFACFKKIESIDVGHFDTSNVTNMEKMFFEMSNLTSLDVSNFDTSNVTNMNGMFSRIINLTSLDLSGFNSSKVTDFGFMFFGDYNLESIDIAFFDTKNATNMAAMFGSTKNLINIDVSHFDTSNVTDMHSMFVNMKLISKLDLSNFDTSNVVDMSGMFAYMSNLNYLNINSFNTSKVTNMGGMFYASGLTILDISNFDFSNVQKTYSYYNTEIGAVKDSGMFEFMYNLQTIYVGNNVDISNITSSNGMFKNSNRLIGGSGTKYNSNHTDIEYAHIDCPGNPGYFTYKGPLGDTAAYCASIGY